MSLLRADFFTPAHARAGRNGKHGKTTNISLAVCGGLLKQLKQLYDDVVVVVRVVFNGTSGGWTAGCG